MNLVDPDRMYIKALDEESQNAIMNMLNDEEQAFVSFNDGLLDNELLSTYSGDSVLLKALYTLSSNNEIGYYVSIGDSANGESFFEKGDKAESPNSFFYGVTQMPGAENNPSPDSDVHVISASFLNERQRISNVAHELLGHAYFF